MMWATRPEHQGLGGELAEVLESLQTSKMHCRFYTCQEVHRHHQGSGIESGGLPMLEIMFPRRLELGTA